MSSDSDSDGPPPLVDSSASDAPPAQCADSTESEDDDDEEDGTMGASFFEQIVARARGLQAGGSAAPAAAMPQQFRQLLDDPGIHQMVEQQNRQLERDRQRDAFQRNFRQLTSMKRDAQDESSLEARLDLLCDAVNLAEELTADVETLKFEAQRHPVGMLCADVRLLFAEARLDHEDPRQCLLEAQAAENGLQRLRQERSHPQQRNLLAKAKVLCGRAHLALSQPDVARREAEAAKQLGAKDLGRELSALLEADSEGEESAGEQDGDAEDAGQPREPQRTAPAAKIAKPPVPPQPSVLRCKKCKMDVPGGKNALKRHNKSECPRRQVECSRCKDYMPASALETHSSHCRMRMQTCEHCNLEVTAEDMQWHLAQECFEVEIECEFCNWRGLRLHLDEHLDFCPRQEVFCDHCYEAMEQYQMCSHECTFAAKDSECAICCTPWSTSKVPAVLLKEREGEGEEDKRLVRACPHIAYCQECAIAWREKSPNKDCPLCREQYSSVAALADWLWEYVLPPSPEPAPAAPPDLPPPTAPAPSSAQKPKTKEKPAPAPAASSTSPKAKAPPPKAKAPPPDFPAGATGGAGDAKRVPGQPPADPAAGRWRKQPKDAKAPPEAAPAAPPARGGAGAAAAAAAAGYPAPPPPPPPLSPTALRQPGSVAPPASWPALQRLGGASAAAAPSKAPSPSSSAAAPPTAVKQRMKFPLPRPEDCRRGETYFISPLDIHFTHDTINSKFGLFYNEDLGRQEEPTLLETAKRCVSQEVPKQVEMIDVIWHDGKIYVAGTFNRRLCVWRLLCLFFPDRFARLKVRFKPEREKERLFTHNSGGTKLTTQCRGDWVEVRYGHYVGKRRDADRGWFDYQGYDCPYDPGVQWPEAVKLLGGFQPKTQHQRSH